MSDTSTSNLMYLPYYMPDVSFNKVKYSNNLMKNGSILITDPVDGIIDINQKFLGQFKNDYIYQPNIQSTTWNIARQNVNNEQLIYFNGSSNNVTQSTKVNQNSIQNFNYNTIFGLTQADQAVIDWNYYNASTTNTLTDAEYSRLGPKLFLYNTPVNNYKTGNVDLWTAYNNTTLSTVTSVGPLSISSSLIGMNISPVDPSLSSLNVTSNTAISSINNIWPYKVQPKDTQYYNILTNGYNEALLALPKVETTTRNQYLLTTKINPATNRQEYSYTDLGDIIQNNYHYIVSYFDTRPTVNSQNINFQSTISSLFLENLIQFFPLANFNGSVCDMIHNAANASLVASCLPFAWTTTPEVAFPNALLEDMDKICPIQLEWGKNITITTELNYTCANMVNLSNILTGWNYYGKNYTTPPSGEYSRVNLPYINIGLVLYVPNENTSFYSETYVGMINTATITSPIVQYDNNRIPVNYYVEIMGNQVILDIDLNSNAKYLPLIYSFNGGMPIFNNNNSITYYELNGIFYQIKFLQKDEIGDYSAISVDNLQTIINKSFIAVITTTNKTPKNIQTNNNVKIFSFGNTTISLVSNDNTFEYNGYNYYVDYTNNTIEYNSNSSEVFEPASYSVNNVCWGSSYQDGVAGNNQYNNGNLNLTSSKNIVINYYEIPFHYSYNGSNYLGVFGNESVSFSYSDSIAVDIRGLNYTITTSTSTIGNVNKFNKYVSWLKSFFNDNALWSDFQTKDISKIQPYLEIYSDIANIALNYPGDSSSSAIQYMASTPCCLPFETTQDSPSRQYQSNFFNGPNIDPNYNFLNDGGNDLIKLVSTYSVPITNALNTTHNSVDTMTFRFEKPNVDGVTDYYYIIGLYMYITKGQPINEIGENPHYIGFAPSTSILNTGILTNDGTTYGIPKIIDNNYVKNTTNLYNDNYQNSILMKDWLTIPSIFMSINESTGNNL